jgi:hypothetical protein
MCPVVSFQFVKCRVSAPHLLCLWTTSPAARVLGMSFNSTTGLSTCLKSSCLKRRLLRAGTCGWRSPTFGRELLEIVLGDVVWLDLMAPHRHLVIDVTVTSARTNTNVLPIGARLPLLGSLALGAQHVKLDADLRTSALLGTPSFQSVHDNYPFAMEDGDRLAPMTAELVYCLAIFLVVRRFHCMGVDDSSSLRSGSYVRLQHFCGG